MRFLRKIPDCCLFGAVIIMYPKHLLGYSHLAETSLTFLMLQVILPEGSKNPQAVVHFPTKVIPSFLPNTHCVLPPSQFIDYLGCYTASACDAPIVMKASIEMILAFMTLFLPWLPWSAGVHLSLHLNFRLSLPRFCHELCVVPSPWTLYFTLVLGYHGLMASFYFSFVFFSPYPGGCQETD
jgi:hypothetical protein